MPSGERWRRRPTLAIFARWTVFCFPSPSKEVETATGKVLNEMKTTSIVLNQKLDPRIPTAHFHT